MKEFLVYTAARLGLFVASYALVVGIYLLVTGETAIPLIWPFLVAVVISAVASVYLLRGQRERFAAVVERRAAAASARLERARAKEDLPEEPTEQPPGPATGEPTEQSSEQPDGDRPATGEPDPERPEEERPEEERPGEERP